MGFGLIAAWFVGTSDTAWGASVDLSPGDDVAALTASLGPGDVITFAPGVYELPGSVTWTGEGTADAPITLRADGAGVILRGTGTGHVVQIRNAAHLIVRGLVIEGAQARFDNVDDDYNGLRVEASSDITLEDLEIHKVGATALVFAGNTARMAVRRAHLHDSREGNGLYAGCNDASCWMQESVIEGCWIHDLPAQGGDGIEFGNGNQGNLVRDNVIHDVGGRGVLTRSAEHGEGNTVEGNAIWAAAEGGMRLGGAGIVRNNLIFNVEGPGVHTQNEREALADLVITHNTIFDTGSWAVRLEGWQTASGLVFANNALANPTGYGLRALETELDPAGVHAVGNVVTGLVEGVLTAEAGHFRPGAGAADFVDAAAGDLYPSETSALLNGADAAGASWVPAEDFNGLPRDGAAPEVGAYEFFGAGNPGWEVQAGFKVRTDSLDGAEEVTGCRKNRAEGDAAAIFAPLALLFGASRARRARRGARRDGAPG